MATYPSPILQDVTVEGALTGPGVDAVVAPLLTSAAAASTYETQINAASTYTAQTDLASTATGKGSKLVAWILRATGAAARWVEDKLAENVSVLDYGLDPTGATDGTPSILAAATALGALGGTINIPNGVKCLIDTNLTLPPSVQLEGPYHFVGSPGNNTAAPYGSMGGCLIINSAATITLGSGAGINGCLIYRKGMTFPAPDPSGFAGTAITFSGDDAFVVNSMVLGFNKGIYSVGPQRPKVMSVLMDNVNCIEIGNCGDVSHVSDCHAWPFSTISISGGANSVYTRTGVAYNFHDINDWGKVTNCFSWGYLNGFVVNNVNDMTLLSCSIDGNGALYSGTKGFVIEGTSDRTKLIGCQVSSQTDYGFQVNTGASTQTVVTGCTSLSATQAYGIDGGDCTITSSVALGSTHGVYVTNASSVVVVDGCRFQTIANNPIVSSVATNNLFIGLNHYGDFTGQVDGTLNTAPSISSASFTYIPNNGDTFIITGTTNFGNLDYGWNGRIVTLIFTGVLTVISSTGSGIHLSGGTNLTTAANFTRTNSYKSVIGNRPIYQAVTEVW